MTEFQRATIVGTGTMGPGMGAVLARAGLRVSLYDVRSEALERAAGTADIAKGVLERLGVPDKGGELLFEADRTTALEDTQVVLEAVPEKLELKQQVLGEIEGEVGETTIFASNTSGIPITKIAEVCSDPSRVVGMHWSNPPHLIPMIEVIPGEQTSSGSVAAAVALVEGLGYEAVVEKEVPGFVENRILYAIMREAVDLVDRGIIDADGMDRCVRWGIGYKLAVIGPMELLDMAGLDIYHNVGSYLNQDLCNGAEVSKTITDRVERGELGIKAGKGLYDYTPERITELRGERARKLVAVRKALES
jgi:3-hydroxybutyryl-CoA dehydrogenase/5-formyl-3-hydroxy-2-methylpyridine 4-carboxylate dehydrogenase